MAAELSFLEVAVSESESKERVGTGNPQYAVFVQGPHYEPGRFSSTLYAYMDECTKKTGPPFEEGRPRPGGRVPSRTTKELFGRALVCAPSLGLPAPAALAARTRRLFRPTDCAEARPGRRRTRTPRWRRDGVAREARGDRGSGEGEREDGKGWTWRYAAAAITNHPSPSMPHPREEASQDTVSQSRTLITRCDL